MSLADPTSDTTPFFSDDSEAEGSEEPGAGPSQRREEEEPASGVSSMRAVFTVTVLCFINLLNYMDRFTVAGVLPDIEQYFGINDGKSGLLQTVFICSYMFLAPIFGYLGDRYNRKIIMSVGIGFWSIVTLASSYTPKEYFWLLLLTRGLVGVGEASYSTIAPTIIADLYIKERRTQMLSVFYFAIPVGSGLGYIVGSKVDDWAGDWHWALRVTPALGLVAVVLLLFVVKEPKRGAIEARPEHTLQRTSWLGDMKALCRNPSFVLSTFGFTAVAFVTGSLALWAPAFLFRAAVFTEGRPPCVKGPCDTSDSLYFGIITVVSGILGVASGAEVSRRLRLRTPRADPLVCALGLLLSAPFLYLAIVFAQASPIATYVFIFLGETFLSMNWAIVADILLYVVVPTRRSTAEAFQIVLSHLLGDAGSPYLIGVVSDSLKQTDSYLWQFRSLQLSLLTCSFVAVGGGAFFLATALFIEKDRQSATNYAPSASIQQRYSEDYTQHTPGFGLAHPPYNPSAATSWGAPPSSLLSPISPQIVLRPNSVTPTEKESNDGYESPRDEYVNEDSYEQGSGYLMVLPSVLPGTGSLCHSNQCLSSQSTENSGAVGNIKINMNVDVEKSDDSDDGSNDYVNTKENSDEEGNMNVDVGKSDDSDEGSNDYVNTKENSGAEGSMNIDVEKSDDSDEEGNDYVNTKDM
ncbi:protein spinster homolog 1 isoform X2 [Salvelinus fontinalis]|uniref:protein spinster homolog 1 isoform X2 n=1 Tax=Salvelinus fontinalis TaxID=8038 RepID=UPI002484F2A7|nr:protein spinster homolog 1 isoform X2 [Salvelinus fontinalis]